LRVVLAGVKILALGLQAETTGKEDISIITAFKNEEGGAMLNGITREL